MNYPNGYGAPYANPMPQQNPMGINPNNPMINMFGGYQNFMNGINQFAQTLPQDPRTMAQQMLNNGQMSQQQFEQCRMMANQILGTNL